MNVAELVAVLGLNVDEQAFRRADVLIRGVRNGLLGVVGVFAGAAGAIGEVISSTAEYGNTFQKAAQKTGVAASTLQEYAYAGKMANVAQEDMIHGLGIFARNADQARQGSAEIRRAFEQLGVQVTDSRGQLRPMDELLGLVADKFVAMPDGTKKTALAMEIFSRSGMNMIPLLNQGSEGIAKLKDEAIGLGVVLDDKAVQASAEYEDSVARLGYAFRGLGNEIGGPLLEDARKFVDELTRMVREHRKAIAANILAGWKQLTKVIHAAGVAAQFLFTHLWILRGLLGWYATFLLVRLLPQLAALTAAEISWGMAALIAGARAAIAGAMAAAAGAAAVLPWALLAAVIYLVADDMYYFFTGGDSLIGRYGGKWTAFLDGLLKDRKDDNWLEAWFKAAMRALLDLQGAWRNFKAEFSVNPGKALVDSDLAALYNPTALVYRAGKAGVNDAADYVSSVFGGGSSPAAQVANSPGGASTTQVNNVQMPINVTVGPGTSPEDTAKAVRDQVDEILQGHLNAAAAVEGP